MRKSLHGVVCLAAIGALTSGIAGGANAAERGLLGINIWRSWRDVLNKYGQPTRIEVGAVSGPLAGGGAGANMLMGEGGRAGGGLPGLPGMGGPFGAGGGTFGAGGGSSGYAQMMGQMMRRGGGRPGAMGAGMSGGPMMSGAPMGAMGPAAGGKFGAMMGGPMGRRGMEGGLGGAGVLAGGPAPGATAPIGPTIGGLGGGSTEPSGEGEVTWVYEKGSLTYMFLFNKDGRVIQIQEFGYSGGGGTSRGVRLGDPVSRVYQLYGWADSSAKSGDQLTLDYSHKAHVAFQLLSQGKGAKVVGITVALTEKTEIPSE
jgi:hypothetical protein